ncbi:MAG TPA: LLM class flavin-dependent oxidoreductase [Thermoanaerobaculia bacterium]|jgi:luciferase family oxidoreductase group 1|nr:LLM class flavin-dependent oxidoreductase [Thermoanaerobaculia bacterium]
MQLSILDQSPVPEGSTGADALRNSVDLARHAERLGYHRYWVAEHHGTPVLASSTPEVLIAAIASATTRLRVGSGGVMLPHYSPFKVAETFSVLGGLFGDRIDLALGRASGTDPLTTRALQRDRRQPAPDDFPQQVAELLAYVQDSMPPEHPFARLTRLPGSPGHADPWLLGSSEQSAKWAADAGLPYAFADFINPKGAPFAHRYRRSCRSPRLMVAVNATCAETDDEAWRLAASNMIFSRVPRGTMFPVPPPEKALGWFASQGIDPRSLPPGERALIGSPATVIAGLRAVQEEYEADELMIVTIVHDHEARKRSYEWIAQAI